MTISARARFVLLVLCDRQKMDEQMGVEKLRNNPKSQLSFGTGPYPNSFCPSRSHLTA